MSAHRSYILFCDAWACAASIADLGIDGNAKSARAEASRWPYRWTYSRRRGDRCQFHSDGVASTEPGEQQ